MDYVSSPSPSSDGDGDVDFDTAWYGNIQYLLNTSALGAFCCVFIFIFVKLRCNHRRMPGPSALIAKLLAVWHATCHEISCHCGADAAQFLLIQGGSCGLLLSIAVFAVFLLLPLNIYAGTAAMADQFSKTTITHIEKGSPLLWIHFVFVVIIVALVHFGISSIEERLKATRFRDENNGNPSDPNAYSVSIFTIMVQGIPKNLAADKTPLEEYFQHRYSGKVYRVIVPMDLCALDDLITDLVKVRSDISRLVARIDSQLLSSEYDDGEIGGKTSEGLRDWLHNLWRRVEDLWVRVVSLLGFTDEEKL